MKPLLSARSVLVAGNADGAILRLTAPLSFWGGVDPRTGEIIQNQHPQKGRSIGGAIIVLERCIGSSGGSSVLLELLACGRGPSGILLGHADAILTLGAIVAREMNYAEIPVLELDKEDLDKLPENIRITTDGDFFIVTR